MSIVFSNYYNIYIVLSKYVNIPFQPLYNELMLLRIGS